MLKDIPTFLSKIHNSIQQFDGSIQEAYKLRHSPGLIEELQQIAPYLVYHKKANSYLFHVYQPLEYIYILLEGTCSTEKYNHGGRLFTDSNRVAMQIFGLVEAMTDYDYHTVSIKCVTDCVYARIPLDLYLQVIQSDPSLMMMSMQFLCIFFKEHIQTTDQLMLDTPRRSILTRLYQYCTGLPFPVTVQTKKEELAQDLNMNLRTLYRQLDKLYEENLVSSHKGKIHITREQYLKIESELSDTNS